MPELAARTTANFAQTPHVGAIHGDGTRVMFEPADIIYVNAGATRSADAWLGFPDQANNFPDGPDLIPCYAEINSLFRCVGNYVLSP